MTIVERICRSAREASYGLASLTTSQKDALLTRFSADLRTQTPSLLEANREDLDAARENGMSESMLDRLRLTEARIAEIADSLLDLAQLPDPVGTVDRTWETEDGLLISQQRVPIGVIGMIYEARPNVTVDAAAICLKTGNAVVLKGGKEAIHSNLALVGVLQQSLQAMGHSPDFIQLIPRVDREATTEFMRMNAYVDVLIPRGSERLIKAVVQNATIPVLETGAGNCHIFVDESADLSRALMIIDNAKTQRPSVCNAVEKVLVHESIAESFIPALMTHLEGRVRFKGTEEVLSIAPSADLMTEEELYTEFLDYVLGLVIVPDTEAAIRHINTYSSSHSESILTENPAHAEMFLSGVTSSTVYHNASTRFTDGGKFGYGAEIGISTSKLHARGPMGLREMTTIKNIVRGNGQIRK